jgi:hypothetical protein
MLAFVPVAIIALLAGWYLRQPKPVPVSGTVTLNGQPIDGAEVSFFPADPKGRAATGMTDKAGRVKLLTMIGSGAVFDKVYPGSYRVTVVKVNRGTSTRFGSSLPDRYADLATSGLTAEVVTEDGPCVFTFNLVTE